ncbi:MAG TPA: MarR family transcriptional regulator [Acidimicrobiales bacterium]|nr:MarR family transcriptional regulator [Acidimicrobiales bacterium]
MPSPARSTYRFGDVLARARQSWVNEMALRLAGRGYPDYRRSDAAVMRLLHQRPLAIGELGTALGVTRQAARKVVSALEARGLATTERDPDDGRQSNVTLTSRGRRYATAVVEVIDELNDEVAGRLTPEQLAAADAALRAAIFDADLRSLADRFTPPPEA